MSNYLNIDWPVLVVEDDVPTADLEVKMLLRAGKATQSVQCAECAIAALNREPFSAVILDYMLAGENGWSVLEAAQAANPPVPVVVVTGHGNENVAVEALRKGAADYVVKNGDYWEHVPNIVDRVVKTAQARGLRNALACAVDSSNDAIINISEGGLIANWNQGASRMFGRSTVDILGRPISELFPDELHADFAHACELVKTGEHVNTFESVGVSRGGTRVDLSLDLSSILNERKRFIGIAMVARDISERKRTEEQLKRTEYQLRQLHRLEAVREIAAGVAHEFNNLLSVIIVRSELMLQNTSDNRAASDIGLIIKTSERAAAVAKQLLAFSGQQFLRPKILDINAAVSEIQKSVKQIVGPAIALDVRLAPDLGHVKADPEKFDEIIINLAINAKDAMPAGGTLTLETQVVTRDDDYARTHEGVKPGVYLMLAISDTGCGMDSETLTRVFEPFFTTKGRAKRSGLSLAMVYGTVKQSGGFIQVTSEIGKGSCFEIYLPSIDLKYTPVPPAGCPPSKLPQGKTILVVEDTVDVLEIVRVTLDSCGYNVLTAAQPLEALAIVERHPGRIDLLVTDVVMPEMNGTELALRLEAHQPDMRVIYMSGYPESHLGTHGSAEIDFIPKPLSLNSLKRKVREVLSRKQV